MGKRKKVLAVLSLVTVPFSIAVYIVTSQIEANEQAFCYEKNHLVYHLHYNSATWALLAGLVGWIAPFKWGKKMNILLLLLTVIAILTTLTSLIGSVIPGRMLTLPLNSVVYNRIFNEEIHYHYKKYHLEESYIKVYLAPKYTRLIIADLQEKDRSLIAMDVVILVTMLLVMVVCRKVKWKDCRCFNCMEGDQRMDQSSSQQTNISIRDTIRAITPRRDTNTQQQWFRTHNIHHTNPYYIENNLRYSDQPPDTTDIPTEIITRATRRAERRRQQTSAAISDVTNSVTSRQEISRRNGLPTYEEAIKADNNGEAPPAYLPMITEMNSSSRSLHVY